MNRYKPAWWLRGGHAQTLWGRFGKRPLPIIARDWRITAPDGEELEIHSLDAHADAPRVLLLHGLEGSFESHYVSRLFAGAAARRWGADLLVFRGCGTAPNVARRFYHSGETQDVEFAFERLRERWPDSPWYATGVSLGGNVLLKWLGEQGDVAWRRVRAAATVSVPFDLEAGARHIARGAARIYDRNFLRTLRAKAMVKLRRYPDLFDRERLARARSVFDFDDVVTAPVHGFGDAVDYYTRSSSLGFLGRIRVPTLLLSAEDDPFLPRNVLSAVHAAGQSNAALRIEIHPRGGHVGFVEGAWPWRASYYAERRVFEFFDTHS